MLDSAPSDSATATQPAPTLTDADRQRFLEQGFLILRGIITPAWLASLRRDYETAVERFQAANPEDWAGSAQPRLHLTQEGLIDDANRGAVQLWSDERLLAVSARMLAVPDPAVTEMMLMCNPRVDHGPANWHRDVHPYDMAPLGVLQDDLRENGPRYVQWNIPLYDDSVLWVVPGSHRRLNTEAENRQLAENACAPLPGGVPVELRAGDAVIYVNYLLHWGSNYSSTMRRTIHGGHALFTAQLEQPFLAHLDQRGHDTFARWNLRTRRLEDLTELALRSAIHRDTRGYLAALDGLHPGVGDAGRLALSCYLSKTAWQVRMLRLRDIAVPAQLRHLASASHYITLNWGPAFAQRFTATEAEALWNRFAWLDQRLRSPETQYVPGFQSGPMEYRFETPSEPTTFRDVIASWG
jgi:ectoine hydroxylase-related dioxygenase (phytanoyl-CoA dioxygenase family)